MPARHAGCLALRRTATTTAPAAAAATAAPPFRTKRAELRVFRCEQPVQALDDNSAEHDEEDQADGDKVSTHLSLSSQAGKTHECQRQDAGEHQ